MLIMSYYSFDVVFMCDQSKIVVLQLRAPLAKVGFEFYSFIVTADVIISRCLGI